MNWKRTNSIESHFRIAGRIVGKVHLCDGRIWQACIRTSKGRVVSWGRTELLGERKTQEAAMRLVEARILKELERWPTLDKT